MKNLQLLLSVFLLFIGSCSKDDDGISPEIKKLIYYTGNKSASTILINTQGGPQVELATEEFDEILGIVNTRDLLMVNVHQAQTLNPEKFTKSDITFKEAIDYDAESIEILYKVIEYFKEQDKKIYVLGISFGAFMTQQLIVKKGLNVADKYLIMVGRLDMNEVFWKWHSEGKDGYFEDGIPMLDEEDDDDFEGRNMNRLAAGLGQNRYTQLLNKYEDLSKITYAYGKTDEAVGSLTEEELQFLKSKNVTVIAGEEGHEETVNDYIAEGFKKAFGI